jgi:hypothetical protein
MEVPLLKSWIQANIDDGISKGIAVFIKRICISIYVRCTCN